MKKAWHSPRTVLAAAVSLACTPLVSYAACTAGTLDAAFGPPATGGYVQSSPVVLGGTVGSVEGVVVAGDNGYVTLDGVGTDSSGDSTLGLAKFKHGGALDTTFGGFGLASPGGFAPNPDGFTSSLAQDPSGNLLVARVDGSGITVTRYTAAGDRDLTFGTAGSTSVTSLTNVYAGILGAATGADGSVFVATAAANPAAPNPQQPAVLKLTPTGALDATFGTGGVAYVATGPLADPSSLGRATDVTVLSSGQIIVVGRLHLTATHRVPFISRLLANGSADGTFGTAGTTTFDFSPTYPEAYARKLAIQGDGKIVAAGTAFDPSNNQSIAVMRVLANGTPDAAFGSGGKVTATTGFGASGIHVTLQNNSKIVVGGAVNDDATSATTTAVAARFTTTGALDTAFGTGGYALVTPPGWTGSGGSEVIYLSGNILFRVIATKSATNQNAEFLTRLDSGSGAGCH
jgi:uncharacterized delta-60 repeat protein